MSKKSHSRLRPAATAGAFMGLALAAACATTAQPGQSSAGVSSIHARASGLSLWEDRAEAILASFGRSDAEDLRLTQTKAGRALIAESAPDQIDAHEKFLGDSGGSKTDNLNKGDDAPVLQRVQNSVIDNGWRQGEEAYLHVHSGMRCPNELVMVLTREGETEEPVTANLTQIEIFDDAGYDTACHFSNEDLGVYLTFYASRWPDVTLEQHFGASLKLIVDRFPVKTGTSVIVAGIDADNGAARRLKAIPWRLDISWSPLTTSPSRRRYGSTKPATGM